MGTLLTCLPPLLHSRSRSYAYLTAVSRSPRTTYVCVPSLTAPHISHADRGLDFSKEGIVSYDGEAGGKGQDGPRLRHRDRKSIYTLYDEGEHETHFEINHHYSHRWTLEIRNNMRN